MPQKAIFIFLLLFFSYLGFSQITFMKVYSGANMDYGYSVDLTDDGGYVLLGGALNPQTDTSDMYLIKTDANGDTLWTKTYGESKNDWGLSVQQTADGGFILFGKTTASDPNNMYLVKTDANGDTLWTKIYGGNGVGHSVRQTTDGGYILFGYKDSYLSLIKTDANGDTLWTKAFEGILAQIKYSVQQTNDGGYILLGAKLLTGNDESMYLIKTDTIGNVQWSRTYEPSSYEHGYSVQQTSDGGYILLGETIKPYGFGNSDVYLIKTDANGDTLWTRIYGSGGGDIGYSVQQTADGGYILLGDTYYGTWGSVWLIKTDANGDTLWTRTYGGNFFESGKSVQQTADGGYILLGFSDSYGSFTADYDVLLIKTDSLGNAPSLVSVPELLPNQNTTIKIYPTLIDEVLFVENITNTKDLIITIHNVLGEMVMTKLINDSKSNTKLNLNFLSSGVYVINFNTKQTGISHKFIKF